MGRPKNWTTREVERLNALMEVDPPYVQWRKNSRGISIAVDVYDPYLDTGRPHKNAGKTECVRGHEFDEENTIHRADGTRDCRTCKRARGRASEARKKAAA